MPEHLLRRPAALVVALAALSALAAAGVAAPASAAPPSAPSSTASAPSFCHPTGASRVVCPAGAPLESVSFVDPTARLVRPSRVALGRQVYVAPYVTLDARAARVTIGDQSNVEDHAVVLAVAPVKGKSAAAARAKALARVGLRPADGVRMAARTVLGHDASVRGPALIGVGGGPVAANPGPPAVILNQGAQVDGAVLEQNSAVSALGRVGPGIVLRSGMGVLAGKNVTTQAEADDPALGKVAPLTEADFAGSELSIAANTAFARDYSRLARESLANVLGVSPDPGGNEYSGERDLPVFGAEPGTCEGTARALPAFPARIIGKVCFEDTPRELLKVLGRQVSLRSDEGADAPYVVGHVGTLGDGVVFHDVPGSSITTGQRNVFGAGSTVHSAPGTPVVLGDDVVVGAGSVVFGGTYGDGTRIGERTLAGFSVVPPGTVIPPRSLFFGGHVVGAIEW